MEAHSLNQRQRRPYIGLAPPHGRNTSIVTIYNI